ncbi:MAG TPA: DEAD/DEAH box helicase [Amnibacterium sp.]|jgi:superfamily II DNA/RNA helicase|uniref:DEAD/DEAH box helicase n=1 Tax=Amnibacterium sp. TaxID=1872496 RepID=UPI002F922840
MATHARNNRTPDGAKRRWSSDERARRDGAPAARRPGRSTEGAPQSRAARRDATFGADRRRPDADGARQDRRPDWYPGPRTNPRERGGEQRGRGRFEDRGDRQRDDRAPRPDERGDRRSGGDRAPRSFRADAPPQKRFDRKPSAERPQRSDRPSYGNRPERSDRPRYSERPERTARPTYGDRPQRSDRPSYGDRPARSDRPQPGDRPRYSDRQERTARPSYGDRQQRTERPSYGDRPRSNERPQQSDRPRYSERTERTERPSYGDRQQRGERPSYGDRPRFDDRPERSDRQQRPTYGDRTQRHDRPQHTDRHDARTEAWTPPEDVVLARLAGEVVTAEEVAGVTFADLGLGDGITKALSGLGAVSPFPIQAATIPDALAGRNVLGRGRTGSGKTIAFGAALVERLMRNWHESGRAGTGRRMGRAPRALILAPTRELALQIDRTVQPIARAVGLFTTQIVGGVPQARQVGALSKGVDIVIGTPGRMEDLIDQGRLDLSQIEVTVLDEADHMADLGFLEPMQRLLRLVPESGQRMLFSATLDAAVAALVDEFLPEPAVHEVADSDGGVPSTHRVLLIEQGEKLNVLQALIGSVDRSLVFARTRAFAEQLADELDGVGVKAESLHGDLNQARRTRNLQRFSDGKVDALVATDVAARGIHVDDIELVVHADAAEDYKTYLHRSGRTGRAGASGTVVTLINARRQRRFAELLERAGIEADFVSVKAGDDPVAALAR